MNKRKFSIIFLAILFLTGVFAWVIFSKKKIVNVEIPKPINSTQEPVISNQQITADNSQQAEDNNQESGNSNQETGINNQENNKTAINQVQTNTETKSSDIKIVDKFISWGFQTSSGRKIDTIVVHSSYDALGNDPYSIDGIIAEYKQYGVSAHYLIGRNGTIYHLVADKNIAWHAGVSEVPDGRTSVNSFSIGIEMINTTDGKFTSDQYAALNRLIGDLKKQYSIKYILGHDDIAPSRKTDPWNIDWTKVQK